MSRRPLPPTFRTLGDAAAGVLADLKERRMDTAHKSDLLELNVDVLAQTERAVQVRDHNTGKTVWLPISQVEITRSEATDGWVVDIPEWLAVEKELV